jgi:acyl-coenzyme A thioesterase PaaI-like protein
VTEPAYPPDVHLLRDLAVSGERRADLAANRLVHRSGLADGEGNLRLGVLATLVDMTGAGIALATVAPDWIATADLSCHLTGPITGDATVVCRPLRAGTSTVVVGAEILDAEDRVCGHGRMAFARIPGRATRVGLDHPRGDTADPVLFSMDGGTPIEESILDRCGVRVIAAGRLELDKSPYVQNSFGTVNGGVQALVAEAAAVSATGGSHAIGQQIHYLERVGAGPMSIDATVVRSGTAPLCEVRLVDRSDDRLVAVADVSVAAD